MLANPGKSARVDRRKEEGRQPVCLFVFLGAWHQRVEGHLEGSGRAGATGRRQLVDIGIGGRPAQASAVSACFAELSETAPVRIRFTLRSVSRMC